MIYCQNGKNNKVKLWTRQHKNVLKEIEEKGVYRVTKAYIKEKNDTIADYYLKLYDWYVSKANFYPLLKNKIINSWKRIFDVNDKYQGITQATIWEIKKEWVVDTLYK